MSSHSIMSDKRDNIYTQALEVSVIKCWAGWAASFVEFTDLTLQTKVSKAETRHGCGGKGAMTSGDIVVTIPADGGAICSVHSNDAARG